MYILIDKKDLGGYIVVDMKQVGAIMGMSIRRVRRRVEDGYWEDKRWILISDVKEIRSRRGDRGRNFKKQKT